MSKRHFEQIARILATVADPVQRAILIERFCTLFAEENPRFDRERFATAVAIYTDTSGK